MNSTVLQRGHLLFTLRNFGKLDLGFGLGQALIKKAKMRSPKQMATTDCLAVQGVPIALNKLNQSVFTITVLETATIF